MFLPFLITIDIIVFPLHLKLPNNIALNAVVSYIIYLGICYFAFLRRKRYLDIEERFKKLSEKKQRIGAIAVVFYIVFSLVFSIFLQMKYSKIN